MPKDSSFRTRPLAVFSVCTYLGSAVSSPCHSCTRAHTYEGGDQGEGSEDARLCDVWRKVGRVFGFLFFWSHLHACARGCQKDSWQPVSLGAVQQKATQERNCSHQGSGRVSFCWKMFVLRGTGLATHAFFLHTFFEFVHFLAG